MMGQFTQLELPFHAVFAGGSGGANGKM